MEIGNYFGSFENLRCCSPVFKGRITVGFQHAPRDDRHERHPTKQVRFVVSVKFVYCLADGNSCKKCDYFPISNLCEDEYLNHS